MSGIALLIRTGHRHGDVGGHLRSHWTSGHGYFFPSWSQDESSLIDRKVERIPVAGGQSLHCTGEHTGFQGPETCPESYKQVGGRIAISLLWPGQKNSAWQEVTSSSQVRKCSLLFPQAPWETENYSTLKEPTNVMTIKWVVTALFVKRRRSSWEDVSEEMRLP